MVDMAIRMYFLHKAFPDLVSKDTAALGAACLAALAEA